MALAGSDIALFESTERIIKEGDQGREKFVVPMCEVDKRSCQVASIAKPHPEKSPVVYNANGASLGTIR